MPKYYCDYCDTHLTHDAPSVRKTHCLGRRHRDNVRDFYQRWMEHQVQQMVDATTAAYRANQIANAGSANNGINVMIPPPNLPFMNQIIPMVAPPVGMIMSHLPSMEHPPNVPMPFNFSAPMRNCVFQMN